MRGRVMERVVLRSAVKRLRPRDRRGNFQLKGPTRKSQFLQIVAKLTGLLARKGRAHGRSRN